MDPKHTHLQLKFCVSGAAETGHCGIDAYDKGVELGRQITKQGAIIVTGATTGFPLWSAMGAKEAGGFSIGFSPANTEKEHVEKYNLPIDYMDMIVYTGFGYPGRDLILTRASDAVFLAAGASVRYTSLLSRLRTRSPSAYLRLGGRPTRCSKILSRTAIVPTTASCLIPTLRRWWSG